jgi:regulatory protein
VCAGDDGLERAVELAYRYLNRRDRTEAEVRRHLERHDVDAAVIDRAIRALADHGSLDDVRFARLYVQDKRQLQQWGCERIRRGLSGRGIDRDLIEEALAAEGDDERDSALELLRRRFPVPPQDRRQHQRALGVLVRKGYEAELALDALASYARDSQQPHTS